MKPKMWHVVARENDVDVYLAGRYDFDSAWRTMIAFAKCWDDLRVTIFDRVPR